MGKEAHCEQWVTGRWSEEDRLNVLRDYHLDELEHDDELTEYARFLAHLCGAEVGLVTIIDQDQVRFIARHGTPLDSVPRAQSLCDSTILLDGILELLDVREDPRFCFHTSVKADDGIRYYAGTTIRSPEGAPLGTICVVDFEPRTEPLNEVQREGLTTMARAVSRRLAEPRREVLSAQSIEEYRRYYVNLVDTLPIIAWGATKDGQADFFNARVEEFTGMQADDLLADQWVNRIHPDDLPKTLTRWKHSLKTGELYETEYRLLREGGEYRWHLARAHPVRDSGGEILRWFGTCTDIHEGHTLMDAEGLVARELSHRIKNLFAVITSLVNLESASDPVLASWADNVNERIGALARAHSVVKPEASSDAPITLCGVLNELLAPYNGQRSVRVHVRCEEQPVGQKAVTPIALLFHELATNAAKYGSLSNETGEVDLTARREGNMLIIDWVERGGPEIGGVPDLSGFGSKLIHLSVQRQLRGTISKQWLPQGVQARIEIPLVSLV